MASKGNRAITTARYDIEQAWKKYKKRLAKDGWRFQGIGVWEHNITGKEWHPFNWNAEHKCEEWQVWHKAEQTPPPL